MGREGRVQLPQERAIGRSTDDSKDLKVITELYYDSENSSKIKTRQIISVSKQSK